MAEIYTTKDKVKQAVNQVKERLSVEKIRSIVGKQGSDSLLTSYATFPAKVCFETQDEEETVILFLRQHPIVMIKSAIIAVFLLTIPSIFVFFPPYLSLPGTYQIIVTLGWYLFVLGYALAKFMGWFYNIYIVTDERVVDVDFVNVLFRKVSIAKIEEIQDVNITASGALETFFGYGSVFIQTAAEVPEFDFLAVPKPDQVGKILNQLIDQEEQEKIEGRVK
jgi:membrane protein YdbS with pleckstrin-like domain